METGKPTKEEITSFLDFIRKQKETNSPRSYISIRNALDIFSIPFPFIIIRAGTPFFRVRVHEKPEKFNSIYDISHQTQLNLITHFGRANEPLQSIFYCSDKRETAFFETSKIARDNVDCAFEVTTIGRWVLQRDIKVANLPLNNFNKGKNIIADGLHHRFQELIDSYKNEEVDDWKKVLEIFSTEFSQKSLGTDNDYMISCAFANYIFSTSGIDIKTSTEAKVQGIMYPSVQFAEDGMNFALKPELIEDGTLKLEVAAWNKMERIGVKEYKDTETVISKSIDHKNYSINW